MTAAPPIQPAADPEVLCLRCGYSLTGLADDGACPECAVPIADSRHAALSGFASPARLAATRRATTLLTIALMLEYAAIVSFRIGAPPNWLIHVMSTNPYISRSVFTLLVTGAQVVVLWGWWSLAKNDPTVAGRAAAPLPNRLLVWSVPVLLTIVLFQAVHSFWGIGSTRPPRRLDTNLSIVGIICFATSPVIRTLQLWIGAIILYRIRRAWAARPIGRARPGRPAEFWMHLVFGAALIILAVDARNLATQYIDLILHGVSNWYSTTRQFFSVARSVADLITPPIFLVILLLARSSLSAALRNLRPQLAPAPQPAESTP